MLAALMFPVVLVVPTLLSLGSVAGTIVHYVLMDPESLLGTQHDQMT